MLKEAIMFDVSVSLLYEIADKMLGNPCKLAPSNFSDFERRVCGVRSLGRDNSAPNATYLYITDALGIDSSLAVCVPPHGCSIASVCELMMTAFDRCRTWYEDCLRLICMDEGVDVVLDAATADYANPIAFLDETGALVYQTGEFENSTRGTLWEVLLARGYSGLDFFSEDEQVVIVRQINARSEIDLAGLENDPNHELMIIPLFDGDYYCGSLMSLDINAPFTPGAKELMRLVSQLAFLTGPHKTADADAVRGAPYYIERLFRGTPVKKGAVEHQFARIGWRPADAFMVYRFETPDFSPNSDLVGIYERQIHQTLPDAAWVHFEGGLVAVCRRSDFDGADPVMRGRLEAQLANSRIWCAISAGSVGFMALGTQHAQCKLALRALSGKSEVHVGFFDELYPEIVRQTLEQTVDVRSLVHPAVVRLTQSGQPQDLVRLESLKAFLLNGRSVAAASRALGVHRNTMLYRLEKLQDEIGSNLYDLDEPVLTCLLVSCLLVG